MPKRKRKTVILLTVALMTVTPAWATDYSTMSNEELYQKRGTMRTSSEEKRNAFRSEWLQRTQKMTAEERQQYTGFPSAASGGSNTGQGQGGGRRMGH